ncbi:4-hydroxythreonine-4-phosphate dehydrogenase PdxA [Desulfolutivibrio sulfoxidireducens]|uniref:4-hydroxythreonine-4-phosphate dehydrogenase PdxA n=1 Tax=Desulfolutivibrio sulfoxidireducens TaxID=2773299 RepID=UPI001FE5E729|nr:4-hydroxythreonine-4-phosphate dehydrogenase PdxA [Desulfolutivibrio sulfoxidireducens]
MQRARMKTVLITLGDPNGLGPELVCRYFAEQDSVSDCRYLLIGPETALAWHVERLGESRFWERVSAPEQALSRDAGVYLFVPERLEGLAVVPGVENVGGGLASGLSLDVACDLLLRRVARAVVTGPISKLALNRAGFAFPGHTEFLAERAGVGPDGVCMHLCGPRLRVSLVTTHPPLRQVPDLITVDRVLTCLRLTHAFVTALGLATPVAVCGVNPHAGEGGLIGREEIEVLEPALVAARREGLAAEGPFPADTIFYRAASGEFSAVLAMYHDQGLGPLKLLHFHECVNVTLGLPFIRTSVGHGTGFSLTGTGKADLGGFRAAVALAEKLLAAR